MRPDVHNSALRAAAKVAFSVAFLGGCGGASGDAPKGDTSNGLPGPAVGAAEADAVTPAAPKPEPKPATPSPVYVDAGGADHDAAPPTTDCNALINAAFPTEGAYPGIKQSVSLAVQTCCVEASRQATMTGAGGLENHQWDCCANMDDLAPRDLMHAACTPWGPPVPPSMKGRARRTAPHAPSGAWTAPARAVA